MKTALKIALLAGVIFSSSVAYAESVAGVLQINVTVTVNCTSNTPSLISFPSYDQANGNIQAFQFSLTCINPVASAVVSLNSPAVFNSDTWYLSGPSASLKYQIINAVTSTFFQNDTPQAMDVTDPNNPFINAEVRLLPNQFPVSGNYIDFVSILYTYN